MSHFRKTILLFAFMLGMISIPFGVTAKALCTSIKAHVAGVIADCKTGSVPGVYAWAASCKTSDSGYTRDDICKKYNPTFVTDFNGGGYCPDGSNFNPCACTKGFNWHTPSQRCDNHR
jgi:hypothetical protein